MQKLKTLFPLFALSMLVFLAGCSTPATLTATPQITPCAEGKCVTESPVVTQSPVPTTTPTPPLSETRQIASGQVIRLWHAYSLNSLPVVDGLVEDFNNSNPDGITVDARGFLTDSQLFDALSQVESSDELPDVVMGEASLLNALAVNGQLDDLSGYIEDAVIGMTAKQQNAISDDYWEELKSEGMIFGIPAHQEGLFLIYNSTWGRELGFPGPPVDLEGFTSQAKAAFEANIVSTDKTLRGTGGWLVDLRAETALAWMGRSSSLTDTWDVFADPVLTDTFSILKDFQNLGYAWAGRNTDPAPYFVKRQALFISAASHDLPGIIFHLDVLDMQDEWVIMAYPHSQAETRNVSRGYGYGLLAEGEAARMAGWLFIQWLMDPSRQASISANEFSTPADDQAIELLANFGAYPALVQAIARVNAESACLPDDGAWYFLKPILEDGYYQVLQAHIPSEQIPVIIMEMQKLLAEYLK
ncbi:MAG: hypothetical protein C0391_09540 [Anaerolinea sp.]|nr:hypothetical protein [Anaerolinea sp.]